MSVDDYFDLDPYDPAHEEDDEPPVVACRYCNAVGLRWDDSTGRWRLVDENGERHVCKPPKITTL